MADEPHHYWVVVLLGLDRVLLPTDTRSGVLSWRSSEGGMTDLEIRTAFHRKRLQQHHSNPGSLVVDEMGLLRGKYRADIAVIGQKMLGFEIKSESDTLRRLEKQVFGCSDLFDEVTLVVGRRHLKEAESLIPYWWGVVVADGGVNRTVEFETISLTEQNPRVDSYSVLQLLWRGELIAILRTVGNPGKFVHENRSTLCKTVAETMKPDAVRELVRDKIKQRRDWRDRQ